MNSTDFFDIPEPVDPPERTHEAKGYVVKERTVITTHNKKERRFFVEPCGLATQMPESVRTAQWYGFRELLGAIKACEYERLKNINKIVNM